MNIVIEKNFDSMYTFVSANFIKQQRLNRKLTMKELIKNIDGLNEPAYQSYESGRRALPMSVLKALCNFYKLDFAETVSMLIRYTDKNIKGIDLGFSELKEVEFE